MLKKKLNLFDKKKKDDSSPAGSDVNVPSSPPPRSSQSTTSSIRSKIRPLSSSTSNSLSKGLEAIPYSLDELQSYGIAGKVKTVAFDPLQSLMAVVTEFNHLHIFGQSRVSYILKLQTVNSIRALKFIKGVYLVAIDNLSTIFVISLHSKAVIHTIISRVEITSFETDYSLEFIYVGLSNGLVKAYNIETGSETILNLRQLQYQTFSMETDARVTSIKLNPRDIGILLISYPKMTVKFVLAENNATNQFIYQIPKGAPGGENSTYDYNVSGFYIPKVTQSLWHPNGLHIVTIHDDNSIVFWDAKTGEQILARTIFDSYVDTITGENYSPQAQRMTKIKKVAWLCESDPERTSILICGGDSYEVEGYHQLIRMDFGKMLSYSMTSYAQMAKYYSQPQQQNIFGIHSSANIVDFIPLGEKSPYFDGNHDPKLIAIVLSDGSIKFLNYPLGNLSFNAAYFPSTLSWLNPKITYSSSSLIDRRVLNGMIGVDTVHKTILKGGIPSKPKFKADAGSLIITGHESGYIRLWNSSEGDLDCTTVFEIDIAGILLDDSLECSVSLISFAQDQLELSCSLYNNDVLLFSYQQNPNYQPKISHLNRRMSSIELSNTNKPKQVIDISDRAPRDVKRGFFPKALIKSLGYGKVTALCNSNVGFVAIGYSSGHFTVIDRRGNVGIYNAQLKDAGLLLDIVATAIDFGYGTVDDNPNGKCCILMYVGTSIGRLLIYKIVADANGRYSVVYIEAVDSNDSEITNIIAINPITGRPSSPNIKQITSPSSATDRNPPMIITSSSSDIRVIKNNGKSAHKTYSKGEIAKIGISGLRVAAGNVAFCLVAILGLSKKLVVLSIPSLSEMASLRIPYRLESKYASQSSVLPLGDVFLRISETEAALLNIMKSRQAVLGLETLHSSDKIFLQNILIPPRPTANQFVKGSVSLQYPALYKLLIGRDRPPKMKLEEYELAWSISPYNPHNRSLLGHSAPKYYDPNALHQHPDLNDKPAPQVNAGLLGKNISMWGNVAQNSVDRTAGMVDNYLGDLSDDIDKMISQAKSDAVKGIVGGKLGI
ncbi:hypothetical protein CANARDRAFT_9363 [[Candida] arabinofermentans NRRL YB-2248]|uniref:Lethal giant larvae (Lgl)-like C-terminal domain-containing protein n=1 Tax=[Candida] arabinofermentans NRRL YB-2248 TaxID=983967 RepID=A0A1E4SWB2_9ASCO|nr:hypothetical protein CANARDRAFT_9363 [[Candida] arabinofermentans NRRL YB-2248]